MDYCNLRNEQFFSLAELNSAIREKLEQFNANTFQKKEGSRRSLFLGEEMPLLATLPATRFKLSDWKTATVQFNYHIAVDRMYDSVPYQYIRNKVDVRITETTVEIFINHNRIASHRHLYGRTGICRKNIRNIWSRMVTVFVNGRIRLDQTHMKLSMHYLPPSGWNNNPIEAVWDC